MKNRKKNENETTSDKDNLHEALVKCGEACKKFHALFFDYEMDVAEMPIHVFLDLNRASEDYRYALARSKQPKVGDRWSEDTTSIAFYKEDEV